MKPTARRGSPRWGEAVRIPQLSVATEMQMAWGTLAVTNI